MKIHIVKFNSYELLLQSAFPPLHSSTECRIADLKSYEQNSAHANANANKGHTIAQSVGGRIQNRFALQ
jgi:hypothetical protein